jgi:TPR repeat protein
VAVWYQLGELYETGAGAVPQDLRAALRWYGKAAAAGESRAMARLGRLYQQGHVMTLDEDAGARLKDLSPK